MGRRIETQRKEWLLIGALLALALVARLLPGERIVDDAYITFRYARNLVEGRGLVYNPDEHVLGTTTPLYALLLAGLAFVTGSRDFPTLAVLLNALAGAASVGLLYALAKRIADHWAPAAAAALLWAVAPYSVTFAIGGMETDLTIALLLAASCAHSVGNSRLVAFLSALAFLARPDTVILLGLLWLEWILERRQLPWLEGAIALVLLAPWLIFGTVSFGSPIPGSIAAKSVTYRLSAEEGLIRLIQHYGTPFFGHTFLGSRWQLIGFFVYLLLHFLGGVRAIRHNRHSWPLLAYPYFYFAVFAAANPLLFRWYLSPPLPFYVLFLVTGVWALGRDVSRLTGRRARSTNTPISQLALLAPFTAAALIGTIGAWTFHPDHGPDRPTPRMAWFELELLYARAADIVTARALPGHTLCAADIGTLGYLTRMPVIDTVGLITPASRRYYPADPGMYVINYAIPVDLILALDPDFVVILEVYGRRSLLPSTRFRRHYRLLETLDTHIYGSDGMLIFERVHR
jgi:hypothetical protein